MSIISRVLNEYVRLNAIDKYNTGEWNAVFTSILFAPIVTTFYLIFVVYLGPKLMKNRRPFFISNLLQAYNCFQVVCNAFLFVQWVKYVWLRRDSFRCIEIEKPGSSEFDWIVNLAWMSVADRLIDLLDSIFHILTKKYSHNSFLHVYHHTLAFSGGWYVARYYPGGGLTFFIVGNTSVHVFMYSYFFASASSKLRPYAVRYKKRITQLQLFQFVIMAVYGIYVLTDPNCHSYPTWLGWFGMTQDLLFLYLFGRFYVQAYSKNEKKK